MVILANVFCVAQTKKDFSLQFELAESLMPCMHQLELQIQPHFEGKLKIISLPDNWIVAGYDEDKNGTFDQFFFTKTNENYNIDLDLDYGQLLYGKSCIIISDLNGGQINFFSINPNDAQVTDVWSKLPKHLQDISKDKFNSPTDQKNQTS